MIKNKNKFIFLTLFIAYTSVYIARVNLSMAGPQLIREGVLDSAQLGILGSCFFVVYAFGRIVNGAISDTAPPWVMLTPGLMLVGLGNILMSLFPPFIGMLLLWTINAYAQSMLWSSVLGSVTAVYDEQAAKRKMSVMITSVAVGNILGIIVNTLFIECFGIRYAFIIPGALTFVMGILTYAAVREIGGASAVKRRSSVFSVLKNRELMLMNGAAAAHGVMKENIGLWMAVYVADVYAADLTKSSYYILLIPAIGLLGRGIYPTLFRLCGKDENKVSLAAFAVCAAAAVFLCAGSIGIFFSVLALGIIYAAVSVINTSVLSIYPLRYSDTGNTASVSETTDFSTYFGAGVSSAVYSAVIKHFGYLPMFVSWAVISVLSIFILIIINKNSAARA